MKATETKDMALITGARAAQSRESTTSVTIGIIGASGAVGSAIAQHLLKSCILAPGDRILLVGHGTVANERKLLALRSDLLDAFDQNRVQIEVVPDIDSFEADIVVVAAGATLSAEHRTRRDLALVNLPIFERIAEACAMRLPQALFIVVSNPVELAVEVLAGTVDGHRVLGMGAQQDSMRFARAIANDLGLSRHDVRASVFSEHGDAMVPVWQSVALSASAAEHEHQLSAVKAKAAKEPLKPRVATLEQEVNGYLAKGDIAAAYRAAADSLPDARIFVEPRIAAQSIHSTPNATANATVQLIAAALAADGRAVHGQAQLRREAFGIEGVCGVQSSSIGTAGSLKMLIISAARAAKRLWRVLGQSDHSTPRFSAQLVIGKSLQQKLHEMNNSTRSQIEGQQMSTLRAYMRSPALTNSTWYKGIACSGVVTGDSSTKSKIKRWRD